MMLYAQDHFGSLSDELLEEIARRLDLNILQVTETLAYYSMLRRKPAGRYHIQVCTNISCMVRGGNEIFEHVKTRLGIGNKEVSPVRNVFSGRSGMHGRLHRRAGMQVNYDFYENLDPDKVDALFEQLQAAGKPRSGSGDFRGAA